MDKLQNPFASGGGTTTSTTPQSTPSDDFLSFSASTPDESRKKRGHFKDRGKPNNLRNAGHFENFRGTPRGSPYPSQRGWNGGGRGGWRGGGGTPQNQPWFTPPRGHQRGGVGYNNGGGNGGTPRGRGFNSPNIRSWGSGPNRNSTPHNSSFIPPTPQGSHPNTPGTPASASGFRGRGGGGGGRGRGGGGGGRGMDRSQSWFHSSMLEDPWASLVNSQPSSFQCDNVQSLDKQPLSDSMLPQVGDSILGRLDTYSAESGDPAADTDKNSAGDEDE